MKIIFVLLAIVFSVAVLFDVDTPINISTNDEYKTEVEIIGLNNYSKEDLIIIESTLEKFYGFDCKISKPVSLILNSCEQAQSSLGKKDYFEYTSREKIVIYATNQKLYSTTWNKSLQGLCFGNQIYLRSNAVYDRESSILIIKRSSIHEVAHSLGIQHCHNTCIMNSESFEFWDNKNDRPIFCEDCKSKLPSRF